MNNCIFCNKEINNKGSLAAHQKQCKLNPDRVVPNYSKTNGFKKGQESWNKGKTLDELLSEGKISKESYDSYKAGAKKSGQNSTGKASTIEKEQERIAKITAKAKLNNGGYRKGSGRGKSGWYKGIWCDSSWELAFVIYHLDNNIPIKRNTDYFEYEYLDKKHKYYPDFLVENNLYEIKGFYTEQTKIKLQSCENIIIIDKNSIDKYLDYTIEKYGKDFISLYEKVSE